MRSNEISETLDDSHSRRLESSPRAQATDSPGLQNIPPGQIEVSGFCERDAYDDLDPLMESIKKEGLIHPPSVVNDGAARYILVCGSRRFHACKRLGHKTIPCYVRNMTLKESARISFMENHERQDRHPVDEAKFLRRMKDQFNWTDEQVAKEIRKPTTWVRERIGILRLDDDILKEIGTDQESRFRLYHAVALSKLCKEGTSHGNMEIRALLKKTIAHRLPKSELKGLVNLIRNGDYRSLPDTLRTQLFKNKGMTPKLANLYLRPESLFDGEGKSASYRRKTTEQLDKPDIERVIAQALRSERPYEAAKKKMSAMVDQALKSPTEKQPESRTRLDVLNTLMFDLQSSFRSIRHELPGLAKDNPEKFNTVCRQGQLTQDAINGFLTDAQHTHDGLN